LLVKIRHKKTRSIGTGLNFIVQLIKLYASMNNSLPFQLDSLDNSNNMHCSFYSWFEYTLII